MLRLADPAFVEPNDAAVLVHLSGLAGEVRGETQQIAARMELHLILDPQRAGHVVPLVGLGDERGGQAGIPGGLDLGLQLVDPVGGLDVDLPSRR